MRILQRLRIYNDQSLFRLQQMLVTLKILRQVLLLISGGLALKKLSYRQKCTRSHSACSLVLQSIQCSCKRIAHSRMCSFTLALIHTLLLASLSLLSNRRSLYKSICNQRWIGQLQHCTFELNIACVPSSQLSCTTL